LDIAAANAVKQIAGRSQKPKIMDGVED
jgi:hypothetical protein